MPSFSDSSVPLITWGGMDLTDAIGPVTQQTMLFPSLRKVVVDFAEPYINHKQEVLLRFQEQLKARKALGAGIETWQFDNTYKSLTTSDLSQFEGLVNVVKRSC